MKNKIKNAEENVKTDNNSEAGTAIKTDAENSAKQKDDMNQDDRHRENKKLFNKDETVKEETSEGLDEKKERIKKENENKAKSSRKYLILGIAVFAALLILGNVLYNVIRSNSGKTSDGSAVTVQTQDSVNGETSEIGDNVTNVAGEDSVSDNLSADGSSSDNFEADNSSGSNNSDGQNGNSETNNVNNDNNSSSNSDESSTAAGENSSGEDNNSSNNSSANNAGTNGTANNAVTSLNENGTPVEAHGKLKLDGTQLVDEAGNAYQLRGVSTHGIAWFPGYVNYDAFKTIRDEWGANCIRLAMYSGENNGYCTGGDQNQLKGLINDGVEYATELGLYVIIDWHVLGDQDPNTYKSQAKDFFTEMSSKYADYDNVIYEICNEPNGGVTWSSVKSYAEEVIPLIKANDPEAIIVVGTPTWSQDVDQAAANPITGYTNIMYALHFYADTHRDWLRERMKNAINAGIPIYVTEFGICDSSGAGANNYDEGNKWIEAMNNYGVSYNIWSLCNKNETASLISSSCSKTSGWTENDLSDSGKWYVGILGNNVTLGSTAGSSNSSGSSNSNSSNSNSSNSNSSNSNSSNSDTGNSNNSNNNQAGGNASASSGTLKVAANCTGNWNDGTNNYYQYTLTLSADGGSVSNWSITVDFGTSVTIDQSWSGNYSASGNTVTVTPVDYNTTIDSGNSCEVGLIVYTSGSIGTPSVNIN